MKDIVFLSKFQFTIIIIFIMYIYLVIHFINKNIDKNIKIYIFFLFICIILILIFFANYLKIHGKVNNVIKKLGNISKNLYDNYNQNLNPENTNNIAYLVPMNLSFINIYYINLDKNTERKEYMENQFKKYGIISYHRISAVDGREMNGKIKYTSIAKNTSEIEIATTISHMKAIKQALNDGHKYALILEDDVSLSIIPYMKNTLLEIISTLPEDWTILVLSSTCNFSQDVSKKKCYSAEAYLINRKGMENICGYISNIKGDETYHITPIKNSVKNTFIYFEKYIKKYLKYIPDNLTLQNEGAADVYLYGITPTYFYKEKLFFNPGSESVIHKDRDIHSFFNTFQKVKKWSDLKND